MWLALPALLGYAFAISRRWQWPSEATFLPVVATLIVVLYLAALVGLLLPMAWLLAAGGLALAGAELWRARRTPRQHCFWSPGTVAFVVAVAVVSWWLRDAQFIYWDEFGHWGLSTKDLIANHRLPGPDGALTAPDYPPGFALFHYFWMLGSAYQEGSAYTAHAVVAIAAVAALAVGRSWWWTAATFAIGYAVIFIFSHGIQNLYVDHLLGLFFGGTIASYLLSSDRGRLIRAIPVIAVLPLLKNVGLVLAVFAGLAIATDWIIRSNRRRAQWPVLLCVLVPIVAHWTWSWNVSRLHMPRTWVVRASGPAELMRPFSSEAAPYQREVRQKFAAAIVSQPVIRPMGGALQPAATLVRGPNLPAHEISLLGFMLLFGASWIALAIPMRKRRELKPYLATQGWLLLCTAAYVTGLLVFYMLSFSSYEAVRLASYERYVGTLLIGLTLVTFAWTRKAAEVVRSRSVLAAAAAPIVFGGAYMLPYDAFHFLRHGPWPPSAARIAVRERLAEAMERVPPAARVYVVWQGSMGFEYYLSRYELLPRATSKGCWSVGSPRFDGDVWTCAVTHEGWSDSLKGWDYVVLGRTDDLFWEEFGQLFDRRSGLVYRVDQGRLVETPSLAPNRSGDRP